MYSVNISKMIIRIALKFNLDNSDITIASCSSICVNISIEWLSRLKKVIFYLKIARKDINLIHYIIYFKVYLKNQSYKSYTKNSTITMISYIKSIKFKFNLKNVISKLINLEISYKKSNIIVEYISSMMRIDVHSNKNISYSSLLNSRAWN